MCRWHHRGTCDADSESDVTHEVGPTGDLPPGLTRPIPPIAHVFLPLRRLPAERNDLRQRGASYVNLLMLNGRYGHGPNEVLGG